jgi:UDP-glucose 4-epimerase
MKVLITGGAGYIGSTIASACADAGHEPVIIDDLSRGLRAFAARFAFYEGDYADRTLVRRVLTEHPDIAAVVHCAASVVVPESIADPLGYYANNVAGLPGFLEELLAAGCGRLVFSSTAALYGEPDAGLVVTEDSAVSPQSPYAASKQMAERILSDVAAATDLRSVALRYFNPIGADPRLRSGLPHLTSGDVLGLILAAAQDGTRFTVTGVDWPTRDGSGLRDYIHVWDLARAHVAALERFDTLTAERRQRVLNLGTGRGTTVLELVAAFERVTGTKLDVARGPRRPGDVIGACASADLAAALLGWTAELTLDQAIADALAWRTELQSRSGA